MYSVPSYPRQTFGTFAKMPAFTPYTPQKASVPALQPGKGTVHDSHLDKFSKEFSCKTLSEATNGFSSSNILGTGSFGAVYRGLLDDDTSIAVKVISQPSQSGFEDEVKILSKFRHPNLVMLLGFARRGTERMLVYECLDKGDCEKRLKSFKLQFTWQMRLSVLLDSCRGIAFLHNSDPIVFHRDIKPSNILVDSNWVGKMADFGLSCELSNTGQVSMRVKNSAGTLGYACPSYVQSGLVTEGSEIYSFGICILEFLTNKPPATKHPLHSHVALLIESVQDNLTKLISLLDPSANWPDRLVAQLGQLMFECTQKNPGARPKMTIVVKRLKAMMMEHSFPDENVPANVASSPFPSINPYVPILHIPSPLFQPSIDLMQTARATPPSASPGSGYLDCRSLSSLGESKLVKLDLANHVNFVIGRNRQTSLFDTILLSDTLRLCVSRDHFTIRRDDNKYYLTNLSGNGTVVEHKRFLERKNETCEIVDGDVIKLVQTSVAGVQSPFVIMKFHVGNPPMNMEQ